MGTYIGECYGAYLRGILGVKGSWCVALVHFANV